MRSVVVCLIFAIAMSTVVFAGMKGRHELSDEELRTEMGLNRALAAYVARNGMPDVAETRFLAERPPWDDHEVRLYYLDTRTEIAFARASILGRPEIQLIRYQRTLSDDEAAALAPRASHRPTGTPLADEPSDAPAVGSAGMRPAVDRPAPDQLDQPDQTRMDRPDSPVGGPAERAEAAAGRAEAAADRLEAAADSAEDAAVRAEAVTARLVSVSHTTSK
jgi:hypothetical protein